MEDGTFYIPVTGAFLVEVELLGFRDGTVIRFSDTYRAVVSTACDTFSIEGVIVVGIVVICDFCSHRKKFVWN